MSPETMLLTIMSVAKAVEAACNVELEKMKASPEYAAQVANDSTLFLQFLAPVRSLVEQLVAFFNANLPRPE